MPRSYPESHIAHGKLVGFSVKQRANEPTYFVYFRGPDGQRLERDTVQVRIAKAREAARAIIEKEYAPAESNAEKVPWDVAEAQLDTRMRALGLKKDSIGFYKKVLGQLRGFYGATDGPADISPKMAATFRDEMSTRPGKREKVRSAHTVKGVINGLRALYEKWLIEELGICAGNPFADVEPPKTDKVTVRWATDEQILAFDAWLTERFEGWELPRLFFRAKAQTGCRLEDLCSVRSVNLRNGGLVFASETMKGRKTRVASLSDDLFAALAAIKGKTFLWERYPLDLKKALEAKDWPTHQLRLDFDPERMAAWVATLFADFNAAHPDQPRLTSHQFRKRAFTLARLAGVDSRDAAIAFGCNPDTMAKHYVGVDEQQIAADVAKKLAGILDPHARKA
jgi:integrase